MKTIRLLTAIIFAIFISAPLLSAAETYAKDTPLGKNNLISMDFTDAKLKKVLQVFSQQSNMNFIASQNVQDRTVTIYFNNVKIEDALNYIMNANNLTYDEQAPGTNIFIVKETGKPEVETITKIYELRYAQLNTPNTNTAHAATKSGSANTTTKSGSADTVTMSAPPDIGIESVIKGVLSKNGKIIADKRSNSLIITDVPSQFSIVENLLSKLDAKTPQVMIRVEMLETSSTLIENLGINWSGEFGVYGGPSVNTIWPMNNSLGRNNPRDRGINEPGSLSLGTTSATLSALLNSADTKTLARPQILTMNNETAEININSNDTVETETTYDSIGNTAIPRVKFIRASKDERPGVTLKVTPTISKSDFITMAIEPKFITKTVSDFSTSTSKVFDLNFRSAKTTVMVKDGETVVIGGLIRAQKEKGLKKVPFFGDIPVLGAAFRYKSKGNSDRELIIFITPNIIKDISYAAGNISEREQEKPKAIREKEVELILDLFGG
jgi:type IV pilus secretin PilQ/predicted competence protein